MSFYHAIVNNQYFIIFHNSLEAAFFVSLRSESAWFGALNFGGHNMVVLTLLAIAGSTLGMLINYGFGYYMSRWRGDLPAFSESVYQRIAAVFARRLFVLMAIPPVAMLEVIPGFGVFAMVNGMFRVPPKRALIAIIAGRILYYSYYLLTMSQVS